MFTPDTDLLRKLSDNCQLIISNCVVCQNHVLLEAVLTHVLLEAVLTGNNWKNLGV